MSIHYGGRGPGHIARVQGGRYDYFVSDTTGNDSNDGLTPSTAWQSLNKITGALIASSQTKRVLVMAGTYDKATDDLYVNVGTKTNTTFVVTFEPGCTIDGTAFASGTQNGVGYRCDTASDRTNRFYCYGNNCVIQNVTTTDGNGIDGSGGGVAYYYDFEVTNARDGISIHETQEAEFHNIRVRDCLKWAAAHVGSCVVRHYHCTFADENNTATLGGLVAFTTAGSVSNYDTIFLPGTTFRSAHLNITLGPSTFERCRLGTLTRIVELQPTSSGTATATKCFLNANWDGIFGATALTRCFGKFTARTGNAGGGLTMTHCAISGPCTGKSNVFYSNYNPGSSVAFIVNNNIFETASFMSVDATNAGYLVAAGSDFHNNVTFGSTYDADLVSAGADIVGTVTSDPLIGAANTLLMADYAYAAGSPAIGAGEGGVNIGFAASEVEELA